MFKLVSLVLSSTIINLILTDGYLILQKLIDFISEFNQNQDLDFEHLSPGRKRLLSRTKEMNIESTLY